jgi:hypothetical protein
MANTLPIVHKRTFVSGRLPEVANTANTRYIYPGELLYGPNFVLNANYELHRENKDNHQYPIDGWYWFNSREEATSFFNYTELTG